LVIQGDLLFPDKLTRSTFLFFLSQVLFKDSTNKKLSKGTEKTKFKYGDDPMTFHHLVVTNHRNITLEMIPCTPTFRRSSFPTQNR
jgi:hypothetical protein